MDDGTAGTTEESRQSPSTLGSVIGELVWLMSRVPVYRKLKLEDLYWLLMPPVVLGQYKLYWVNPDEI